VAAFGLGGRIGPNPRISSGRNTTCDVLRSVTPPSFFDSRAEARWVTVKWLAFGFRFEELELVEAQDTLVDLSGLLSRTYDFDHVAQRRDDEQVSSPSRMGEEKIVEGYNLRNWFFFSSEIMKSTPIGDASSDR
jgi:hypothetical protein